jgi:hypothetical protein
LLSFRQRSCFCFDEESTCHSDRQRFFSREKLLQNDIGLLSFRQAKILQSRKAPSEWHWAIVIPTGKVSSVAKSSFRMTVAFCHSDRQRFFSREKLLQNDSGLLSFRQAKILQSRKASSEWQWRFVIPTEKDSSVTKSSFRMTVAYCHSDREAVFASINYKLNLIH